VPAFRATYRVQLHAGFTFDDAAALTDYLDELGVSHLYCSPYLQAAAGSTHGYDVVDHGRLNEELGGAEGHARMTAQLAARGMGQLLDIVPNHMALDGRANRWWWDVLENGPSSQYAAYFDIDWDPPESKLRAKVLMPVLGDHYGRVLEAGELQVVRERGSFLVRYHDHEAPLSPRSLDDLLAEAAERVGSDELASIATALGRLPHSRATDRASVQERHRDKEVLRGHLAALCEDDLDVARAVDDAVKALNEDVDALDALLERQNYRLAFWRTAGRELDYRRFFDISTLVALRMEDEAVFAQTHELVLRLVSEGAVHGLRVDHVDGLRDPEAYLALLDERSGGAHVVVEKILEVDERLPATWPVAGTSGYDFLNRVNPLFVDPAGEAAMTGLYVRFTGETTDYAEVARRAKHQVMREALAADVERLTAIFVDVCEGHRRYRDHTRAELRDALREVVAAFPVYRTYVHPGAQPSAADAEYVTVAAARAAERRPDLDLELLSFLVDVLLLRHGGEAETELALRFQQVTSPVMAKGVEDTAFYRFNRLVSLNEVGGDPGRFGTTVEEFHRRNRAAAAWPGSLLATSTHDTKRSEDVRARISLLSEIPARWEDAVWRWAHLNERHRRDGWPDRNAEYLLYQTLVGAWPLGADRAVAYMEKAAKEAKVHTSWVDPVPEYDAALRAFVEGVLADGAFVAELERFVEPLVEAGRVTSLAQVTLKLTGPGIPDLYQGTEVWDLSLVDPDNRRPVDYAERRELLAELAGAGPEPALAHAERGGPKLWLIQRLLLLRRRLPAPFATGAGYEALSTRGAKAAHAVAYLRGEEVAVVVPRLVLGLDGDWGDTEVELPSGTWVDALGGASGEGTVGLAGLLARFPVAVLRRT
jgi:(1->4)-alpha-D-glucan 1-alpha-D-glucosylmutase